MGVREFVKAKKCVYDAAHDALMIMAVNNWKPCQSPEYLPMLHYQTLARLRNKVLTFDASRQSNRPAGHYLMGTNMLTLRTTAADGKQLAQSLVHEATHQLVDQRLKRSALPLSPWLEEGLATYFEHTYRDKDGNFQRGVIGGNTTAAGFLKTLDPSAGFAQTNFVTVDTTNLPDTWGRLSVDLVIDAGLVGQLLQYGFVNTASDFDSSNVFYDNVLVVLPDP